MNNNMIRSSVNKITDNKICSYALHVIIPNCSWAVESQAWNVFRLTYASVFLPAQIINSDEK